MTDSPPPHHLEAPRTIPSAIAKIAEHAYWMKREGYDGTVVLELGSMVLLIVNIGEVLATVMDSRAVTCLTNIVNAHGPTGPGRYSEGG